MYDKGLKIRTIELSNKSRKGSYIYIKEKGKSASYYKYDSQYPLDYYVKYYQEKETRIEKRKGKSIRESLKELKDAESIITDKNRKAKTEAEKYLIKLKKQYGGKRLEQLLKKGLTATTINNAQSTNNSQIHTATTKLLEAIVLDKKLRDLISQEENIRKIKNRLEHKIMFIGEKGNELLEANIFGKTIREVVQEINMISKKGEEIEAREGYGKEPITEKLKGLGYQNITAKNPGKIGRVQIITIYRKNK
jgi:hypothetical protein